MSHVAYRRDIDGLRSIAVGSVVLFHAGFTVASGGFIGVDIFFVISGYLISVGLFKEGDGKGISIAGFYERRIRRILPAYAAVILATLAAGLFILLPSEYASLAKSALAATTFVANIHFWTGMGYFAGEPLSMPLLHMWSLAVEEQFYVVWPILLLLLYRFRMARWRLPIILGGIVVTLAASEWMLDYSAKTAFYMAPLRAWELLLGALLAYVPWPRLPGAWAAHGIGALALALMLVPVFTYDEASRFPGLAAVPPCLGAALIIYRDAKHVSFAAKLLSMKLPVFIGLISYSLYLWHWPILSFYWFTIGGRDFTLTESLVLLAIIMLISAASWRFIERPFRKGVVATGRLSGLAASLVASTKSTLRFGVASLIVLALGSGALVAAHGLPSRVPVEAAKIDAIHREPFAPKVGCVFSDNVPSDPAARCFRDVGTSPKVVLWGDSFAGHHIKAIEDTYAGSGVTVLSVISTGCGPFPGATSYFGFGRADVRCKRFNEAIFRELMTRPDVQSVIIAGRWSNLYGLKQPGEAVRPTARFLTDDAHRSRSLDSTLAAMQTSLDRTVSGLIGKGRRVTLLLEPPEYAQSVPKCVARAIWKGESRNICASSLQEQVSYRRPVYAVFAQIKQSNPQIAIVDPLGNLCPAGICSGYAHGVLLTADSGHLMQAGSRIALANMLRPDNRAPQRDVAHAAR